MTVYSRTMRTQGFLQMTNLWKNEESIALKLIAAMHGLSSLNIQPCKAFFCAELTRLTWTVVTTHGLM